MRGQESMTPRSLASLRRNGGTPKRGAAEVLKSHLGTTAEVRPFEEADEPILAPSVRAAVFEWLAEIRAREELLTVGVKPRSTAFLYGPPGCGKTTLAHHVAARLGVPLVLVGPETIISSGWGEAEKTLSKLFTALQVAETPCVVFFDEMESLGGHREQNKGGSADNARTSLLGVLLRKIEAFDGIMIGASNRHEDIDPALWRRFGMQLEVALPDDDARFAILLRYGLPFRFEEAFLGELADLSAGASPSLLRQLMEGVKRRLVLGRRMNRAASDAAEAFADVVAAVRPAPEYAPPPLWQHEPPATYGLLKALPSTPWPPEQADG